MSRVHESKRAYDAISGLLDQEIRKRSGSTKDLEEFRRSLNVAFYLIGWAQFEYLLRRETDTLVGDSAKGKTVDAQAWKFVKENIKSLSIRNRLDILFHADQKTRTRLNDDYTVRNEAAHDYKLPARAGDVSAWLKSLEEVLDEL